MTSVIEQSFHYNLLVLRVLFLYPPEKHKSLYRVHTHLMYLLLSVPVPVLECVHLFLLDDLSFGQIADNLFLMAELVCIILKLWPFLNNSERIKKCIHFFDSSVFKVGRPEHEEILGHCVKICRGVSACFLCAGTAAFVSWSIRPISWKNHVFPTDLWLPFDVKTAPKSYIYYAYIYIVVAVGYGAYASMALDPLIAGLAYQATCQIKILKHKLQFLQDHVNDAVETNVNEVDKLWLMHEKIRQCAIHYDHILKFVKEFEHCFSLVAFSQFVSGVIVLCVSCLQLALVEFASFDFLAMVMYIIATLFESYLYCHFGTLLYKESNSIIDAIYLGEWYNYDIESRKALILIMERAKRPMIVTCGKVVNMSLITFMMILRWSYSLLAVLRNYNIKIR